MNSHINVYLDPGKPLSNLIMPHFHKDTNNFVELRDNRSQIYSCYGTSNNIEIASVKM